MRHRLVFTLGAIALLLLPAAAGAVEEDVTPPELVALTTTQTAVDVTHAPAQVTLDATVTDDLSGLVDLSDSCTVDPCRYPSYVAFRSPSGGQTAWGWFAPTGAPDAYRVIVEIPRFGESGTWRLVSVHLFDWAGNTAVLDEATLAARGIAIAVDVTSAPDTSAPEITALSVSPPSVDASTGDTTFTVRATIVDAPAGVSVDGNNCTPFVCRSFSSLVYASPTRFQTSFAPFRHVGGDEYEATVAVRQHAEGGAWKPLGIYLADLAGNVRSLNATQIADLGLDGSVVVESADADVTAPVVQAADVAPAAVDVTAGPATVTVSATITDDRSGVRHATTSCPGCFTPTPVVIRSPSGRQIAQAVLEHVAGDDYRALVRLPRYAEAGYWRLSFLPVEDRAGNRGGANLVALEAAGANLRVAVSKVHDGGVPPGGTVTTDREGNGATAVDPVEATVTTPTGGEVAIQVTPTTTPEPRGFALLGQQLNITAPPASVGDPLRIEFEIYADHVPSGGTVDVFRNGVLVAPCTGAPQAIPDPCVENRTTLANGNLRIVVLTSQASAWNFGVRIATNTPPDCTTVAADRSSLWPANHKLVLVTLGGGSDEDGDALSLRVTGVTQDEPTNGLGDGDTGPDARAADRADQVWLRAERSGKGDGRVYRVAFELSDGAASCSGAVSVAVPHSAKGTARDSGAEFDSLRP